MPKEKDEALAQNPLDIADRAYFAGKQAGIEETLAQPEQEPDDWDTCVEQMPLNKYCLAIIDWHYYSTDWDSSVGGENVEAVVCKYKRSTGEEDFVFIQNSNDQFLRTGSVIHKWKPLYTARGIYKKLCAQARRTERGACHQIVWDYGFSRIDNEEVQAACVDLARAIQARGQNE